MEELKNMYINYTISSFEKIEMTKLGKIAGVGFSHDRFTTMLLDTNLDNEQDLWKSIKPLLRSFENNKDGCIVIDDTILHKPHTKESDTVCWHYDHTIGKSIKGIGLLNFLYTNSDGVSLPLGYEIISKSEMITTQDGKQKRVSLIGKNDMVQDKLQLLTYHNQVQYKYVLFDKWFASNENMVFIDEVLNKKFVCPLKNNRLVALSIEDKNNGKYVSIEDADIGKGSSRLLYLKGYEKPLQVTKQVFKDGNDDESPYLYLASNDMDIYSDTLLEIYQRRWKIEEYHKSLKQNLKIEHSPTKVETSQRNHIFLCILGFIKLEKLRLNYKMNHFAIKEKIYLEALKVAYQKVCELQEIELEAA